VCCEDKCLRGRGPWKYLLYWRRLNLRLDRGRREWAGRIPWSGFAGRGAWGAWAYS
jgi:hypothetical protein